MKKLCALMRIEFFSQQNDTKIINFDEGVLILWPFFLRQCHFQDLPLLSSGFATSVSRVIDVPQISIVWLPRVKCLLLL